MIRGIGFVNSGDRIKFWAPRGAMRPVNRDPGK